MPGLAETEKQALVATLRSTDPDAPTLCEGWDTKRLLAHLVQREQDHGGALRDALARPQPGQEPQLGRLAAQASSPQGYTALIDRFVAGPSRWSPFRWAADQSNLLEYTVHHEDVRRGRSGRPEPRALPPAAARALFRQLGLIGRLRFRRSPVGVSLALPGGPAKVVHRGTPVVTLTGEAAELALWLTGRRQAAAVEVTGPPDAVQTFSDWAES